MQEVVGLGWGALVDRAGAGRRYSGVQRGSEGHALNTGSMCPCTWHCPEGSGERGQSVSWVEHRHRSTCSGASHSPSLSCSCHCDPAVWGRGHGREGSSRSEEERGRLGPEGHRGGTGHPTSSSWTKGGETSELWGRAGVLPGKEGAHCHPRQQGVVNAYTGHWSAGRLSPRPFPSLWKACPSELSVGPVCPLDDAMQRSWEGTSQSLGSISLCRHSRPPGEGEAAPLRTVGHTRLPECPCITEARPDQGRDTSLTQRCPAVPQERASYRSPCGVRARALRSLCRHCWPGLARPGATSPH